MLSVLKDIWCAIVGLAWSIADVAMWLLNHMIAFVGGGAMLFVGLLPNMPDEPDPPSQSVIGWANWLFPIGALLTIAGVYLALYITARTLMAGIRVLDSLGVLDTGRGRK